MSDLEKWIEEQEEMRSVPESKTVTDYPQEMRDAITKFLEMKASGKTNISLNKFRTGFLKEKFGYKLSDNSFARYLERYESKLLEKIRNNDRRIKSG